MNEDAQLLRRYAMERSEAAFAELVHRHVDLVYSAACRLMSGDVHRAQDVTQQVFAELARRARHLSEHPALLGWLYTTIRRMALRAIRTEQRRTAREQEANIMNELLREPATEPDWEHLRPVLEDAMHELGEKDRMAVLLRFFKNNSLNEVGLALGLTENAARMRVDRALDKLRLCLARKGVRSAAAALALTLSGHAVTSAPAGFAASLASATLAGAASSTGSSLTFLKVMATTKLKLGLAVLVVAGTAATLVMQQQSQASLRAQNQTLRQQILQLKADNDDLANRAAQAKNRPTPRLPAPVIAAAQSAGSLTGDLRSTNLYARLKEKAAKVTVDRVAAYLDANRRNAASLLAAYRVTGDHALLEEAMQKYPADQQVGFEAAFRKDATPAERQQWLESFKKSAPDNALPNYLSALDFFQAGQPDQAVRELIAASGKPQFQDYSLERVQDDEEAYLGAGYSIAEAKALATSQLLLPQLAQVKQLSLDLFDLAKSYRQAGDEASAQATLEMAANLGRRYSASSAGESEISQLVGMWVERNALTAMDPNSAYGSSGQTVQDRIDQITQQNATLRQLGQQVEPLLQNLSEQDWISYKDRWMMFGEESALKWVIGKYGQK